MLPKQVAVLSQHSLLIDGIASQLRENRHLFKVVVIDVAEVQGAIEQLLDTNPESILLDAVDAHVMAKFSTTSLLELLPMSKIIQVNWSNNNIQVFMSEQWRIKESGSLIAQLQEVVS